MSLANYWTASSFERLPVTVVPLVYDIVIEPDLVNATFTGSESVSIRIVDSVDHIILSADDLLIDRAAYASENSEYCAIGKVIMDRENQQAIIKFHQYLQPGHGTLHLSFKGNLNDQMKGFYRCKHKSTDGKGQYSTATQFETTYARRAFPCWDEPAIKAKFQITIIAPKDLVVLSNTKVISEELYDEDPNLKVVKFAETPIMSTYLVAFVIGEYEYLETKTGTGTLVRVYTPIGAKNRGQHALETAAKCLTFFENYFNIPYPLEKIDHIVVPELPDGAMKNWGLVVYQETHLLQSLSQEDSSPSSSRKDEMAYSICHGTAHQWIGNLVTAEWWDHSWIYEGLATFMQYLAVDSVYPELHKCIWSEFAHIESFFAFESDSSYEVEPLQIHIENPIKVDKIMESKRHHKGASIIRMCYDWIGDEIFRKGLHDFLVNHAYKTATTEDLWHALETVSQKCIAKMMSTWTKQPGFPVIHVSFRNEGNKRILILRQERFLADKLPDYVERWMLWHIPIAVVTSHDPTKPIVSAMMETKTMEIPLEDLEPSDWVKINPLVTGFYYAIYSSDMLKLLKPAIQNKQIGTIDRHQLLNDLSVLVRAGKAPLANLLHLLSCYDHEDEYTIWEAINIIVDELILCLKDHQSRSLLRSVCLKLYAEIYKKLGFDALLDENPMDEHLRVSILEKLIEFDDEMITEIAKMRFADYCRFYFIAPDRKNIIFRAIKRLLNNDLDTETLSVSVDME